MEIRLLKNEIKEKLSLDIEAEEIDSIINLLLEDFLKVSRTSILMDSSIEISDEQHKKINAAIERLNRDEPIQHILGKIEFYGRSFMVNRNVLIPRPETEELVHIFLKRNPDLDEKHILDIGTGSGIIPITIKKERPGATVYAVDISTAALATAKRNAALNLAEVNFIEADILSHQEIGSIPLLDAIISNPPYVRELEKAAMRSNVLNFEPEGALFVSNDDPLLFYKNILDFALQNLKENGVIYFEINEYLGPEMIELCVKNGFANAKCYTDMQGKNRFIICTKK